MQKVVVVVGGGFVVVVEVGGFVVVVDVGGFVVVVDVGGFVVVVDVGGFVVVVVGEGLVVVVVDEGFVVDVVVDGFVVVVDDEEVVGGEVVEVAGDAVEVVVGTRVVVVPDFTGVTGADEEEATVDVESSLTLGWCTSREVELEATARSEWVCIKASPPAAVVPSATDPATRATWDPAVITVPRLLS
jgi:hypothetical protein